MLDTDEIVFDKACREVMTSERISCCEGQKDRVGRLQARKNLPDGGRRKTTLSFLLNVNDLPIICHHLYYGVVAPR